MTSEWIKTTESIPNENDSVIIILKTASGCNAIFKNNKFVSETKTYNIKEVEYWKLSSGVTYNEIINKKCKACGRTR